LPAPIAGHLHSRVLELVGEVSGTLDLSEFCDALLIALSHTVPSDYSSLNQVVEDDPDRTWAIARPTFPASDHEIFARLAMQNPLAERLMRTRDGRPLRFSDVVTPEELHATDLYREFYVRYGIEHQIAFALPSDDQQILAIALSRCERDYEDEERELLALARPHLIQAYRNALEYSGRRLSTPTSTIPGPDQGALEALGLTPTQARVLRLIATGRSTQAIATELNIAQRTVHKHLQRTYKSLGVVDRFEAADAAWQTGRAEPRAAREDPSSAQSSSAERARPS
jgi:DNA-binding CsgD family transcriptional regulator